MQKNPCLHNGATQIFLNLIRDFSLFYNLLTFFIIKSPQLAKYARPAAQSELRSLAQGLLRPLCACWLWAVGEMPYTEWAIWCTAIMIMMCAARKRVLILAV